MSGWKAKRFWTSATVEPAAGGHAILLDGRPVRTPAKRPLVVPTTELAGRIAAEWGAQGEEVKPLTMPFTRSANAAIDKVAAQKDEVADLIAAYGDSDLLCYRAEAPAELVSRQSAAWDPLLAWSRDDLRAPLIALAGVIHVPQNPVSLDRLTRLVQAQTRFQLTALHDLVSLTGSLVLGLAVTRGRLDAPDAWSLSRLDEDWQIAQWGADDEASDAAERKRTAFLHAAEFYACSTAQ